MKTIKISNKLIILLALVFVSGFYSCETTELELQNDPNNLTPDSSDPKKAVTPTLARPDANPLKQP
jgi:hypothetical protein